MKRTLLELLVVLAFILVGGFSHAGGPPVLLAHTLTGYHPGSTAVTVDFSLHVENLRRAPLTDLTLSVVTVSPLFPAATTVNLGHFDAHEKRDVFVQLVIPVRLNAAHFSKVPLHWDASYRDAEGKIVEFAAESKPGGAK